MQNETTLNGLNDTVGSNLDLNETIGDLNKHDDSSGFQWTSWTIAQAVVLFFLAGVAEIGGGWMVWMYVRGGGEKSDSSEVVNTTTNSTTTTSHNDSNVGKPWWWGVVGSIVLVMYGFIPCLQPTDSFGRIYAA